MERNIQEMKAEIEKGRVQLREMEMETKEIYVKLGRLPIGQVV